MIVTVGLFLIVIVLLLYWESRKPEGYPPGPKWWPILGCAMEIARLRKDTGYLFKTCSVLCEKYGPVIGLKIGNDRIVILNDYNSASSMLTNPDCEGRPTGPMYKVRTWGKRRGLILVDGQLWIEQRRFILRHLREIGYGRNSMTEIVEDEALKLVEHLEKLIYKENNNININNDDNLYQIIDNERKTLKSNIMDKCNIDKKLHKRNNFQQELNTQINDYKSNNKLNPRQIIISMNDAFGVTVLNTLWRMMAGKRFNTDDETLMYLQKIFNTLFKEIDMIGAPFSHFPFLRFIAPKLSGYQPFVEVHQQLWLFLRDELNNYKNTFNPNAPRNLIDVYLSALNSNKCSETFSESQLLAICVDFFVAGSETTSKTLSFGFLYLILFPDVQRKAQEEIDRVIGCKRLPTLADRSKMTYINAIVLESLRMFAGRSLNVPHRALKNTYIMGHRIPKDTMIIVNFNGLLMNNSWNDPEEFRPERFIDKNGKISVQDQYFPFSIGRHRCMGETLARSNLFIVIACLLQRFTFSVVPGEQKPSTLDIVDGATASLKPFKVLVTPRT
ncbi:PREDICTED: probable cytochrome P450 303a1 [Polistes canadensis]|uniref:probable cytochrome P450 303a1 n=1 Tax=Polistes canadensis TaxID=91411 RepID=UPI000718DCD7|nr:PREDICTED: probable cytochrome P450 303a1 [Polistes canadensis]